MVGYQWQLKHVVNPMFATHSKYKGHTLIHAVVVFDPFQGGRELRRKRFEHLDATIPHGCF